MKVAVEYWRNVSFDHTNPKGLCTVDICMIPVEERYMMRFKSVIFVVDVSGSMEDTLPSVKASLLAFRDVMVGNEIIDRTITNQQEPSLQTHDAYLNLDRAFRSGCNVELITFNDIAKRVWSSTSSSVTFTDAVSDLCVGGRTNMGDAIQMAFSGCIKDQVTWIVVLTDGVSNSGRCQTTEAFVSLVSRKPKNSKIITLGYGTDFNPDILTSIGSFTYLEDTEAIPYLMGSVYHEISTSKFFDVRHELTSPPGNVMIGSQDVGVMFNERNFIFGASLEEIFPSTLMLTYTELTPHGLIEKMDVYGPFLETSSPLPDHIVRAYYVSEASRYIDMLYKASQDRGVFDVIKAEVERWTDERAIVSREHVLRILNGILTTKGPQQRAALSMAVSARAATRTQSSYVMPQYMSPTSIASAEKTLGYSKEYN
jgi:uncharacterized protein YegL